ncbi:MAG: heme-binding domain-containing protein [Acidobacteriia bacterium]|nr:heme-binding domain-containing protein [Terriglobia bacterium]
MRKLLKWAGIALMGLLAGSQFIRPARTNPPTHSEESMEAYVQVPGDVASVLDRACRDCHSHETQWPWYSNTAPVSWFVIDHVNHGRKHLNFSDWNHTDRHGPPLGTDQQLEKICREVSSGEMPLGSYLLLHPEAKISTKDAQVICEWSRAEQARIATSQKEGRALSAKP